jgi:hypothetical protein
MRNDVRLSPAVIRPMTPAENRMRLAMLRSAPSSGTGSKQRGGDSPKPATAKSLCGGDRG